MDKERDLPTGENHGDESMGGDGQGSGNKNSKDTKPTSSDYSQPMPDEYSNEANHRGATDLGTDGTKPTASQQQGQGAWNATNKDNRTGSESGNDSSGGQGGNNKTGDSDSGGGNSKGSGGGAGV